MYDKTAAEPTFETFFESVFRSESTNDVLAKYAAEPPPHKLCGDLWREGEMALVFGETGTSKSILAVQMGEAIARGSGFGPFEVEGGRRKVLYFDLKHSDRQWADRYSREDSARKNAKRKFHKFPAGFERVPVDILATPPGEQSNFAAALGSAIGRMAEVKKASVVIIDGVELLKRSNDFSRDVLPLIRELHRLKLEKGISVLVVGQSNPRHDASTVDMRDLGGGRILYNFADSVFAVGVSGDPQKRYIKQIKTASGEKLYDATHTVECRVSKTDDIFLEFVFGRFASETAVRGRQNDARNWEFIDRIKAMHDAKETFRDIGKKLGISKTAAHRYCQMWVPPPPPPPEPPKPEPPPEPVTIDEPVNYVYVPENAVAVDTSVAETFEAVEADPFNGFPPCEDPHRYDGLTYARDDYGRDIWVAETYNDGKRRIWYYYDSKNRWCKATRVLYGVDLECMEKDPDKEYALKLSRGAKVDDDDP